MRENEKETEKKRKEKGGLASEIPNPHKQVHQ